MIDVIHDHGLSLAEVKMIRVADAALAATLAEAGLAAVISRDFAHLTRLNREYRDQGVSPLVPWYDHRVEPMGEGEGLWIGLLDRHNEFVGFIACRLRAVPVSLAQSLRDMTFLFPDAKERGAWGELTSIDLETMRGNLMLPGAMWISENHRGKRLSKLLFALAMVESYARWKPDQVIGLVELPKENAIGFFSYVFPRSHKFFIPHVPGIEFTANGEPLAVMSMTQWEMRERFLSIG